MSRIHDGVIAVDAEQLAADVTEQFLERAGFPRLTNPAWEQAVAGDRVWWRQGQLQF